MKIGNKKASKVCDSEVEARNWLAAQAKPGQYDIEHRRGEATRCESYCPVADFCPQRRAEIRG